MKTIKDIETLANDLLKKQFIFKVHGVRTIMSASELGYTFKWDNAKRRFGCCYYGKRTISLSKPLCSLNLDKIKTKITDTILHEIAHALCVDAYGIKDGRGHTQRWANIAKEIGSDGKRCYDANLIVKPISKYTLTCPTCSTEITRHRVPKYDFACSSCCNGTYDETHKLIIKKNY